MRHLVTSSVVIGTALAFVVAAWVTPAAGASCAYVPPTDGITLEQRLVDGSNTVFTGTVEGTRYNNRLAIVAVESVWKGADLPPKVAVAGSADLPGIGPGGLMRASSEDHQFQPGQRYLWAFDGGPPFVDEGCGYRSLPYKPEYDRYRPGSVRPPNTTLPEVLPTPADLPTPRAAPGTLTAPTQDRNVPLGYDRVEAHWFGEPRMLLVMGAMFVAAAAIFAWQRSKRDS